MCNDPHPTSVVKRGDPLLLIGFNEPKIITWPFWVRTRGCYLWYQRRPSPLQCGCVVLTCVSSRQATIVAMRETTTMRMLGPWLI